MTPLYVINPQGCYFKIEVLMSADYLKSVGGCMAFESKDEMLAEVVKAHHGEFEADELEHGMFIIKAVEGIDEEFVIYDHRGIASDVELDGMALQDWIADYDL